jgi:hypothetical protein
VLRMNIHSLVIDTICARADQYEGQSTLDGLQMTSMKSAMDEDMVAFSAAAGHTRCLRPVAQQPPRARARLRPEPGSVVETNASRQPGERPLQSPFRPFFEVTGVCSDADDSGLVIAGLG